MSEQAKTAALQEKIKDRRIRAIAARIFMFLFLVMAIAGFCAYILIVTGFWFIAGWFNLDLVAIGIGGLGTALTAICWAIGMSTDNEKEDYIRQLHEIGTLP